MPEDLLSKAIGADVKIGVIGVGHLGRHHARIAAESSRYSAYLFTFIPGLATSMIIFPEVYIDIGNRAMRDTSSLSTFYRGMGWFFLFVVILTALVI